MIAATAADDTLATVLGDLASRALDELEDEGIARDEASVDLAVDCRYVGQSHELRIAVEGKPSFEGIAEAFHDAHRERYGFARTDVALEAITFRAAASGPPGAVEVAPPRSGGSPAPVGTRRIGGDQVPVYRRGDLPAGWRCEGPAVVVELDSTTWIDRGASADVHPSGTLVVDVR
jgi:N-methylhydantoinase A